MLSLREFARELKKFDGRKEVTRQLRTEIRKPVPVVRKRIKASALDVMPKGGALNVWVSKIRTTVQIKVSGRSAGVRMRGGRNSSGGRSDIRAIDRGRVRAPAWGHRTAASWHTVRVSEGFFRKPVAEAQEWRIACYKAVRKALKTIRRG